MPGEKIRERNKEGGREAVWSLRTVITHAEVIEAQKRITIRPFHSFESI